MIGTEMMLLGERRAARGHRARAARPQRHRQVQRAVGRALPQPQRRRRRSPTSGASPAAGSTRCARCPPTKWDEEGFTPEGPGPYRQFMAIRVFDCWYHDQDIREALDRPGLPRRRGRRPRRSGASRPRRCRTSSARRPARRRARRSCSTSPVSRRSMRRSASKGAPRCSRPARSHRPRGSRSTGAPSRDWPAGAGPARTPAPPAWFRWRATTTLGTAHRRQPRVHDLTALNGRTTSLHAGGRRLPGRVGGPTRRRHR